MDAQTRAESEFTEPGFGASQEGAVVIEPQMEVEQEDLGALEIRDSVFVGNGVPTLMLQEKVVDAQSTMSGYDHDYCKPGGYSPIDASEQEHRVHPMVDMQPRDLQVLNIGDGPSGEDSVPLPTGQGAVVEVQATGSGDNCDSTTPVYTVIGEPHRGQGHYAYPTGPSPQVVEAQIPSTSRLLLPAPGNDGTKLHVGTVYGPVYQQPYLAPVPPGYASPAAAWTLYQPAAPQAYQQVVFAVTEAGGPGPNSGTGPSQFIDMAGGCLGGVASGYGTAAAAGPSGSTKTEVGGLPVNCPQTPRDIHNAKERLRRARMRTCWDQFRQFVPTVNGNTDSATVSERAADYTRHMTQALSARYGPERAKTIIQEFIDTFHPH